MTALSLSIVIGDNTDTPQKLPHLYLKAFLFCWKKNTYIACCVALRFSFLMHNT